MPQVYAVLSGLQQLQEQLPCVQRTLENHVGSKDELIERTINLLIENVENARQNLRAEEYMLESAEKNLRREEDFTREYNRNLAEGETPSTTPQFYYDLVDDAAENVRIARCSYIAAEEKLEEFQQYVKSYRTNQWRVINEFEIMSKKSQSFFDDYIDILQKAKKCTQVENLSISNINQDSSLIEKANEGLEVYGSDSRVVKAGKKYRRFWSKDTVEALSFYSGEGYISINSFLRRKSTEISERNKIRMRYIHQALNNARIPKPIIVYRGASESCLGKLQGRPDHELIGKVLNDAGFMSTSFNEADSFRGNIKLIISVPKGAKGAYIGYLSQMGHDESEILFDAGQQLIITKVKRGDDNARVIYADMII